MKPPKQKRKYIKQEDVPALSLEEALRVPRAIFDSYGKHPTTPFKVAAAMDLSPTSSHFKMFCGASIAYGLTDGGCNAATIALQPLVNRILAHTKEGDDLAAKREAFVRPNIIKKFVEQYNKSPLPNDTIATNVLVELGVSKDKAASVLALILTTANDLGLVKIIKGKKYLDVEAPIDAVVANELYENDQIAQRVVTPFEQPEKLVDAMPNGNHKASDSARSKRVFITHGKNKAFVDPIKKLLAFGELEPVVAVEKQTVSEPVPEKVMNDMRSCGAAIIHVENEQKLIDNTGTTHSVLNPNVLIEIGAAMALYGSRFILLVRTDTTLPSNLQGLYTVRYQGESLDGEITIKLLEAINELKKRPLVVSVFPKDNTHEPQVN